MSRANVAFGLVASSVIGGTASVIGGGKFSNGATTGAFGYFFNAATHSYSRDLTICDVSNAGCSPTVAFSGLRRSWYPGVQPDQIVQDGGTYLVMGTQPMTSNVDYDNLAVVNTTQSEHIFCCGSVSLSIVQSGTIVSLSS